VAVANGDRVTSLGYCPALDINIAGENFVICCYGLLLGSYDMVLGVQWLESHGPIHWDFGRHTLAFVPNGRHVLWSAAASPLSTPTLAAASLDMMDDLLLQYTRLFDTPIGLPPDCKCCHRIRLPPSTEAVAVRPYRYAYAQKEEIEQQCAKMLRLGVIHPSESSFSALVILVKKHDGSWRMCFDYRDLNDKTV
jgi:hypothetical protein